MTTKKVSDDMRRHVLELADHVLERMTLQKNRRLGVGCYEKRSPGELQHLTTWGRSSRIVRRSLIRCGVIEKPR